MEDLQGPERAAAEEQFRALYADAYADVLRFASRRVHPTQAEDVVAEAFLVVWRRLADVPSSPSAARAWIFGIARRVTLNSTRSERRRAALQIRLADPTVAPPVVGMDPDVLARRVDLARVWPRLAAIDQETLALTYWEHLTSSEAAVILGISPVAFRLRLTRARRRLRAHLGPVQGAAPTASPITEWSPS